MHYLNLHPYIHLLIDPMNRQKTELEIILHAGGSLFEKEADRGKKHLLEHCIASRTQKMDFQELKDYQFRQNLMLNAYTGPLTMGLTASGHHSDFKNMLDLLLEMAFLPTFDQSILQREKEIVLREISERRGDPAYRLHYAVNNQVFTSNSYENHEVLGNSQMVASTTLEDFEHLHQESLNQSHLLICASGGEVDLAYVEAKLQSYLSQKDLQPLLENPKLQIDFEPKNEFQEFDFKPIVHELAHSHGEVYVYLPCIIDFEAKGARQIFESLFLRYGGVLYDRLRDELGLVYGLQTQFDKDLQALTIYLTCEIQLVEEIIKQIEQTFSNFQKYFRPEKFEDYKQIIRKKQDIGQDTLGAAVNFTQNMLRTYGVAEKYGDYGKRLDEVTIEQVQAIYEQIGKNWSNKKVVVISKEKEIEQLKL